MAEGDSRGAAAGLFRLSAFTDRVVFGSARATGVLDRSIAYTWLALAATILSLMAWRLADAHGTPIVDDAYISLIYARNLAHGAGLTYTDGVRVEGYTNFLWVLLAAAAIRLHLDPVLFIQIASFISALSLVLAVWLWTQRYSEAPQYLRFAPVLLASTSTLAFWALGGLETPLFAVLVFSGTAIVGRTPSARACGVAGVLYFLGTLTHPDAILWVGVAVAYLLVRRSRGAVWLTASFAVPFGVYWALRMVYFGDFWPNTFHAKDTASMYQLHQGWQYIKHSAGLAGAVSILIIGWAFVARLRRRPDLGLMIAQSAVWIAYIVYVGGDALLMQRFWLPVLAPASIVLQESVASLTTVTTGRANWLLRVAIPCAVVVILVGVARPAFTGADLEDVQGAGTVDGGRVALGRWFGTHANRNDVIALEAAGAVPYVSERPAIDMLGLNDRHIARFGQIYDRTLVAHKRFDTAYVLDRKPAFIVLAVIERHQALSPSSAPLPSTRALLSNRFFRDGYDRVDVPIGDLHEVVFARKDRAAQLVAAGQAKLIP